jgi:AraC-like DNA-binding protein
MPCFDYLRANRMQIGEVTHLQMSGTIATGPAQALLAMIGRCGTDPSAVAAKVGVRPSSLEDGLSIMPLATFTSILEVAAADRCDHTLGLQLGSSFPLKELGPIAVLVMSSRTVGDALEKFTKYFPCLQSNTRTALSVSNGVARLAYSISDSTIPFRVQDAIFTLALEYAMIRKLLGHAWKCSAIDFEHVTDSDLDAYRTHFNSAVRFRRQENAISFPAYYLNEPNLRFDEARNSHTEAALSHMLASDQLCLELVEGLEAWMIARLARSVSVEIELAASEFGMSLRSFQRKLSERGVSYLEIRNRIRVQIGKCLLSETNLSVTAVALYLGYSETSAFTRAFSKQVGMSPYAHRARGAFHAYI